MIKELRKLTIEELKDKLSNLQKEIIDLEFKIKTAQESDTSSLRTMKKDVARVHTIINEKITEGDVIEKVDNVVESKAKLDSAHSDRQDAGTVVKSESDK